MGHFFILKKLILNSFCVAVKNGIQAQISQKDQDGYCQ